MKSIISIIMMFLCASCSSMQNVRNGSSMERAVQLCAKDVENAAQAEHEWIAKNILGTRSLKEPPTTTDEQVVYISHRRDIVKEGSFSVYVIEFTSGRLQHIYFDMSGYSGGQNGIQLPPACKRAEIGN